MISQNMPAYSPETSCGVRIAKTYNQRYMRCNSNHPLLAHIRFRLGETGRAAGPDMSGILDHLVAYITPEKTVERTVARLLPEHLDHLELAHIDVEPVDDADGYRTVEPLWVDGYYAHRRQYQRSAV